MNISALQKTVVMNVQLIILFTICSIGHGFSQNILETEQKIRDSINAEFIQNYSGCYGNNAVTNFNTKIEFWKICKLENNNRIIQITSHDESTYFREIYFEKEGKLIYAKEVQKYTPMNSFEQMNWNCEFYIKDLKVITMMSLGHGKTENEDWDQNSIIEMYHKRIEEIAQIQQ